MTTIEAADASAREPSLPLRHVAAVAAGNALGFYDFLTYSFFAAEIGRAFFPFHDASSSLLASLATFGAGFFTRPLGGVVIGIFGDRAGRKPAMFLSFTLMGAAIVGLALTPSYASIGIAAPILAIGFRLLQGFALGGEVGPTTAYLVEAAPPTRRGFYGSLQYMTQDFAILCAGLVGVALANLLDSPTFEAWGWRIAFLLGSTIVPFALWIRRELAETLDVATPSNVSGLADSQQDESLVRTAILGLVLLGSGTIASYALIYLTTFAKDTLHMSERAAFGATIVTGLCGVCFDPLSGLLSDRFGRKTVMMVPWALFLLALFPAFLLMVRYHNLAALLGATAVLSMLNQLGSPSVLTAITEALPRKFRSGALSIIYAIAIATFGGSAQFIMKWLTDLTGNPLAPAWYLGAAVVIGFAAMLAMKETAPAFRARLKSAE